MIKVITIDFWNTLFDSSNGTERNALRQRALIQEIDKFGISVKNHEFNEAIKASWDNFNSIWLGEQRTPQPIDSIKFLWNYLNFPEDKHAIERLTKVFAESILHHPPSLLPDVKESLKELSSHYTLGIVSDTGYSPGSVLRDLMRNNDIYQYFSAFSFSDETGVSKPNPKAFSVVLEQFDCLPNKALHIGDIEKTDILGAKSIGMKAIRFNGDKTASNKLNDSNDSTADAVAETWQDILVHIKNFG